MLPLPPPPFCSSSPLQCIRSILYTVYAKKRVHAHQQILFFPIEIRSHLVEQTSSLVFSVLNPTVLYSIEISTVTCGTQSALQPILGKLLVSISYPNF